MPPANTPCVFKNNIFGRRSFVCSPTPTELLSLFDQVEVKMISYSKTIRTSALLCTILTAGFAVGQDGVVRMSDRSNKPSATDGVVQMRGQQAGPNVRQVGYFQPGCGATYGEGQMGCGYCPQQVNPDCIAPEGRCCDNGGGCYVATDCNTIFGSCDSNGMPACWCQDCHNSPCQCRDRSGRRRRNGRRGATGCDDGTTVFAHSVDSGTGSACRDLHRGHAMSFHNKNARLADKLFGWMIPSGCCGQGCPPIGKYHMTYANQPDYVNPNDTQIYAAQGYGMPITVPLAPNVNHTYNYSSGIPASRITTIGNYNPQTSPQRLPHQTW